MKSRGKKFRSILGGLHALPKMFRPHPGANKPSKPVRSEVSAEALISAVFEATGYRMSEQQAEKLRVSLRGLEHQEHESMKAGARPVLAGGAPGPDGGRSSSSEIPPSSDFGATGGRDTDAHSAEGAERSAFPGAANDGGGRVGLDPGIVATPPSLRDEVMNGARELHRELNRQEPSLSRSEMVELIFLVRRLGQLFFEQSRDRVTHAQLQDEIASLKHLIESKGK